MFNKTTHPISTIVRKTSDFVLQNPATVNADIEPVVENPHKIFGHARPYWLYALKLADGKYYVGYTGRYNPYDRIMQHVEGVGDGVRWTEMHIPLEVIEIRYIEDTSLARIKALEQNLTWEYMKLYGANNVRGGRINYTGRVFRIGDRILMGYMVSTLIAAVLGVLFPIYIYLRHYLNWW